MRLLALLCCATLLGQTAASPARTIIVISDLHMGPGRDGAAWHPFEDFRWRDEFVRFLEALRAEGDNIDLVINGDLFELVQSPDGACDPTRALRGCTEAEVTRRLDAVINAHAEELAAIGRFAAAGSNRVHVIPGDHDAALLLPGAWRRAAAAFAAPAGRVEMASAGKWLSPDRRVHVEHGHQLPLSADRFGNWPNPVVTVNGRTHVERPWGEHVALPFYNRTELRYPIVDNVAEEGVGAKLVAAADGRTPPEGVAPLLRFLLTKTTWQQFRMDLDDGEVQAPAWDVKTIRGDLASFLATSLPSDDPFSVLAKRAPAEELRAAAETLTDSQIVALCDYRAAIRRARRRMERVLTQLPGVGPPIAECPRLPHTVGPAFEYYWRSRDQQVKQHVADARALDVIVFGHTHLLDRPFRPFGDEGPVVVNSGAWQRTVVPLQVKHLDASPEALAPCYGFVRLPPSTGDRTAEAGSWRLNDEQRWAMRAGGC